MMRRYQCAFAAAKNIVETDIALWEKNIAANGIPFVRWNAFSKRCEFMHLEEGFSDVMSDAWILHQNVDIDLDSSQPGQICVN